MWVRPHVWCLDAQEAYPCHNSVKSGLLPLSYWCEANFEVRQGACPKDLSSGHLAFNVCFMDYHFPSNARLSVMKENKGVESLKKTQHYKQAKKPWAKIKNRLDFWYGLVK